MERQLMAVGFVAVLCVVFPQLAYAGPMQDSICTIVYYLWGDLGTGLAMLGIMAVSGAAILGKASWGMALTVVSGVGIMFSAGWLTLFLLGLGNGDAAC